MKATRSGPVATAAVLGAVLAAAGPAAAQAPPGEARIRDLERVIERQQEQLDALRRQVEELRDGSRAAGEAAAAADQKAEEARKALAERPLIESSDETRLRLKLSGQVNRAVNLAADGRDTRAYFVDNDVSSSRVGVEGTAELENGVTLGTVLELGISPNNSYDVSQEDEEAGVNLDGRFAEVYARRDDLGRLSFGKGQGAADDVAEYDLSLVAESVMYAGVADPVGGLQFTDGDGLSGIAVGDAFFDFDGDRQNRVAYVTPVLGGLQLDVSAGADQRYDAALKLGYDYGEWTGVELGPFKTLAGVAIQDPSEDGVDYRLAGSWSVEHVGTGLGLTLSAGTDHADGDDPYNLYGKLSWDAALVGWGGTGLGVDLTRGENLPDPGDEGYSIGLAALQKIEAYSLDLYGQLRWFSLDRDEGPGVDDIYVSTVGARIAF
jgi:predicted porin